MANPLVLLVEDNPRDSHLVEEALKVVGTNCSILCLENAVQALSFLAGRPPFGGSAKPSLIVVDLNMPVINGFQFLEILRNDPEWSKIPTLVLTARTNKGDADRAATLGVRDFLLKPNAWDGYVDVGRRIGAHLDAVLN